MRSFLAAIAFLTRVPVGRFADLTAEDVTHSAAWFPLIGLMLGGISAAAAALLRNHLPLAVAAVLLLAIEALMTGALHFDGLADTCDGFGGGRDSDDTLRIMRDHAIGSYGALALILAVALKATAYAVLLGRAEWLVALVVTPALGRWSILLLTAALPYARSSASVVQGMGRRPLVWGTLIMTVFLFLAASARAWIAVPAVAAVAALFGLSCRRRIQGVTGDTLGASVQLCESAALLVFLSTGPAR